MEFTALMDGLVWAFQPSAFFTRGARSRMMRDVNTILHTGFASIASAPATIRAGGTTSTAPAAMSVIC
jgi:hypothetical protein